MLLSYMSSVDSRGNSMKLFCISHTICLFLTGNGLLFSQYCMNPSIYAKTACCLDHWSSGSLNAATDLLVFS